jgi:MSHA biogenesis protein MshK
VVDPLKRSLLAIGIALAGTADAAGPSDPTRPPNATPTSAAAPTDVDAGRLVLQSVLVAPDRRVAVVSGVPLTIGDEVRGHRLLRVTDAEAVLHGPAGPVTLKLYPHIERRPVKFTASVPMKMASSRRKPKS